MTAAKDKQYADFIAGLGEISIGTVSQGLSTSLTGDISFDMIRNDIPDSAEGCILLGLTYAASFLPGSSIFRIRAFADYDNVRMTVKCDDTADANILAATEPLRKNGEVNEYKIITKEAISYCTCQDAIGPLKMLTGKLSVLKNYAINLSAAHQVKPLKAANIEAYFKAHGVDKITGLDIEKRMSVIASGLPIFVNRAETRNLLENSDWVRYHTTYSAVPRLLVQTIDAMPPAILHKIFSPNTVGIIRLADEEYWNKDAADRIPDMASAFLFAYLTEFGDCPQNFWGPSRKYAQVSTTTKNAWKVLITYIKSQIQVEVKAGWTGTVDVSKMPPGSVGF